jgi:hypothetical protein
MRSTMRTVWLAFALLGAASAAASAQTGDPGSAPPVVNRGPQPLIGGGTEVALGGGVMNFTGSTARAMTGVAGSWNLRLATGTRTLFGLEAAYLGSAQGINATGLDPNATLISNGGEAVLRLNAPVPFERGMVTPFLLGGIGWTHFSVVKDTFNNSVVSESDNVGLVPVGAGLAVSYAGFVADARFTYRFAFDNELFGNSSLNTWAVTANIGRMF